MEALLLPGFFFVIADVENDETGTAFDLEAARTADDFGVILERLPHGKSTRSGAAATYAWLEVFEVLMARVHGFETTTACAPVRRFALKTALVTEDKSETCDDACRAVELGIIVYQECDRLQR